MSQLEILPAVEGAEDLDVSLVDERSRFRSGRKFFGIYLAIVSLVIVVDISLVCVAPGTKKCESAVPDPGPSTTTTTRPLGVGGYAIGATLGASRQKAMQASGMVMVSMLSAFLCTVTSAFIVTFRPLQAPEDFVKKGTLSNASQDVSKPFGRMFAVMLFIACTLSMVSMYPLHIYPNWFPWIPVDNAILGLFPFFQSTVEVQWRVAWATLPYVGLMYTALLPSLSDNKGTNIALTMVHNVAAPLAMAFTLVMETYQLARGENAFAYFFCTENATWNGPLTPIQRLRVVVLCNTWVYLLVFLGIQVYFGLGDVLGLPIKTSYSLALVSFYSEITGLVSVFCLPAIQGFSCLCFMFRTDVLLDASTIQNMIISANQPVNDTFRFEL